MVTTPAPLIGLYANLLNTSTEFWSTYRNPPGGIRRSELRNLFEKYPGCRLPVNNNYQANLADIDLARLLKKGFLIRVRGGGGARHAMNKSSRKRQTYLVVAPQSITA